MKHVILQEPLLLNSRVEVSIATPTNSFLRELYPIFNRDTSRFNIVILILKMENDIMEIQGDQQIERDSILDDLMQMGILFKQELNEKGYFIDYIDPVSGLALHSNTNEVYADATGCERILKMDTVTVGCCKLISHKKWSTNIYPFTLFTTAPAHIILEFLQKHYTDK